MKNPVSWKGSHTVVSIKPITDHTEYTCTSCRYGNDEGYINSVHTVASMDTIDIL